MENGDNGVKDYNMEEGMNEEVEIGDEGEVIELPDEPPTIEDAVCDMEDLEMSDLDADVESDGDEQSLPPIPDHSKHTLTAHTDSVFCVDVSHSGKLLVSGGEDDMAFLWKIETLPEVILQCTGHKDSVTCVGFSFDDKYICTGDMNGLVKVWKTEKLEEAWSTEIGELEWLLWHSAANVLLGGTRDGDAWMWKIPSGETKTFTTHGSVCSSGVLIADGKSLCTGYDDGSIRIWDLRTCTITHEFTRYARHRGPVTSIVCHPQSNVILTASVDCKSKLINTDNGKLLTTYDCKDPTDGGNSTAEDNDVLENSIEAIGFSPSHNLLACGTLKGLLTIWDTKYHHKRHTCKHQEGITCLKWQSNEPTIIVGTIDGIVHAWNGLTGEKIREFLGHRAEILCITLNNTNNSIICSSGDSTIKVFDT